MSAPGSVCGAAPEPPIDEGVGDGGVGGSGNAPGPELSGDQSSKNAAHKRGALLYLNHCAACHKARGVGVAQAFPPLNGNPVVTAADPANIIDVVLHGIPIRNHYPAMPAFASQLSDRQASDLINYIRSSWDNHAAADVSPRMVTKRRTHSQ